MKRLDSLALFLLAMFLTMPRLGHAAEGYSNCTGFISAVPAVIDTAGTWCVNQNLSTSITSGNAITIAADGVTLDCNDFKLDGLAGGTATTAIGVFAQERRNATVRHCNIRGFSRGVNLIGSSGGRHLVEDSRFDGNTLMGISLVGDNSVIRRNRVFDTGGSTAFGFNYGIAAGGSVDILDNVVSGVVAGSGSNVGAMGVYLLYASSATVSGNLVRGLVKDGSGTVLGIYDGASGRHTIRNNDVVGDGSVNSVGVSCPDATSRAKDNVIKGFATGVSGCGNDTNVVKP